MAIDGIVLNRINTELVKQLPLRINKIYQISNTELLFQCHGNTKVNLIISCHSIYNRINLTSKTYPTPESPSNFVMLLRKQIESGSIISSEQFNFDRYLLFKIRVRNEIGDFVVKELYIELMGKYANVILVDENNKIIDALKRIPPFENNQRTIQSGATFKTAKVQENKVSPLNLDTVDLSFDLTKQIQGFSPLLSKECEYRISQGEDLNDIVKMCLNSNDLYYYPNHKEPIYHIIPLTHLSENGISKNIMDGLDFIYFDKEEKDRIKQMTGDIFKLVNREIKHLQNKIPKLEASYNEALDCDKWREYGDYLNIYSDKVEKGTSSITVDSFYDDSQITIPLNPKLDGKQNAKKHFQKYNKGKKAQVYLTEQIENAKNELDYFNGLYEQLELANFNDAKEIKDELVKHGYLKDKQPKIRKKQKEQIPSITKIKYNDDISIYFGKNNIQNEYLTFKFAHKDYTWFHTKDYHGAHVVITTDNPDEDMIRKCAMLAVAFSKGRDSSSVPVDYTLVKNLKKIPASKIGLVSMSTYKTIYIDPDSKIIEELLDT